MDDNKNEIKMVEVPENMYNKLVKNNMYAHYKTGFMDGMLATMFAFGCAGIITGGVYLCYDVTKKVATTIKRKNSVVVIKEDKDGDKELQQ